MARQGFASMDVNDAPPSSFTAVTASATETNLWTPAIWTPIPANDMRAGKIYKVSCGGILSTTTGTNNLTITARCGQSSTPSSNVSLGATTAVTQTVSLSSVPWYAEFTLGIRSLGLAASGATGTGNGFFTVGDVTTTAGKVMAFGGTVATTIDNTAATGLILSATWSAASNSITCQWVCLRSYN